MKIIGNPSKKRTSGIKNLNEKNILEDKLLDLNNYKNQNKLRSTIDGSYELRDFYINENIGKSYFADSSNYVIEKEFKDDIVSSGISTEHYKSSASFFIQDKDPRSFFISPDGSKLFYCGNETDTIYQYDLPTNWDIENIIYSGKSLSILSFDNLLNCFQFSEDGTKIYALGNQTDSIYQYTLSTPWDLSGATYSNKSFNFSSFDTDLTSFKFSSDGLSIIVTGNTAVSGNIYTTAAQDQEYLYQFDLNTAWDISTVKIPSSFSVNSQETSAQSVRFSSDGTKCYVLGSTNDRVYQYTLSTPWNISTASYSNLNFSVASQETTPTSFHLSSNGTKLFVVGTITDTIYSYTLSTPWNISTATYDNKSRIVEADEATPAGVFVSNDGYNLYMLGSASRLIYQYTLSTPFDLNTIVSINNYCVSGEAYAPSDLYFDSSGSNLYISDSTENAVYQYTLSTPWSIKTASYTSKKFLCTTSQVSVTGLNLKSDGTALYVIDTTSDRIFEYPLRTAWDLSTAYGGIITFNLSSLDNRPSFSGIDIVDNQKCIYITSDFYIYKVNLLKPWKIDSYNHTGDYKKVQLPEFQDASLGTFSKIPMDIKFDSTGNIAYVLSSDKRIYQFYLEISWDLTSFNKSAFGEPSCKIRTNNDSGILKGIEFSEDGEYLCFLQGSTSRINLIQSKLNTPWDLSTIENFKEFPILSEEIVPYDVCLSGDGVKAYIVGRKNSIYQYTLSTPWDISTATYDNISFDVSEYDTLGTSYISSLKFSDDGLLLYVQGYASRLLKRYQLTTPWDISTINPLKRISVTNNESLPTSVGLSTDGTQAYVVGTTNDTIYQYTLSTPWDISTGSYANKSFNVASIDATVQEITFNYDGTRIYILGSTTDTVQQFTLSTPWDISTIQTPKSLLITSQESLPTSVGLSSDGTKAYVVGTTNDTIYQYTLSTPWDISTGSYANKSFSINSQQTTPQEIKFNNDGTSVYVVGDTSDKIIQYSITTPWDISTAVGPKNYLIGSQESSPSTLFISSDGTKAYVVGTAQRIIYQYTLSTPWNINTSSYSGINFSVSSQETTPTGIYIRDNGTNLYVIGQTNDRIYQYTLSTPWNISTATYTNKSYFIGNQDNAPNGMFFKPDGTKLFIVGQTSDTVHQYTLTTPWDISTARYDSKRFYIGSEESVPQGLFFKSDGTKFYVTGSNSDLISEYILNTPWDISTAYYTYNFITLPESSPTGLYIGNNGQEIYIIGQSDDRIYQFTLNNPWDITSSKTGAIFVGNQELVPTSLSFSYDGSKAYILGNNRRIYQYNLKYPWNIGSAYFDGKLTNINVQETAPTSLSFNDDGFKLYIMGTTSDSIFQYDLSIPWDVSTAVYSRKLLYVSAQETLPQGFYIGNNGTQVYVIGTANDRIYQYTLNTPWDISTSQYNSLYVGSEDATFTGLDFSADQSKLYLVGASSKVYVYELNSPGYLSGAYYNGENYSILSEEPTPQAIKFNDDGTKFYIVGTTNRTIFEYNLTEPWNIRTTSYFNVKNYVNFLDSVPTSLFIGNNGQEVYIIGQTYDNIIQFGMNTSWDLNSSSYISFYSSESTSPNSFTLSSDGKNLYLLDINTKIIHQYNLLKNFNISTAKYVNEYFLGSLDSAPLSFRFNPDGSKLYLIGTYNDTIYQYFLSTPWDITTLSYEFKQFSVNFLDTSPTSLCFGNNGYELYILGSQFRSIYQVSLETPWDISTSKIKSILLSVGASTNITRAINAEAFTFGDSGRKLYVTDSSYDEITQLNLKEPWNISTSYFYGLFHSGNISDLCYGISFRDNGTKVYLLCRDRYNIQEFSLNTPWDITTVSDESSPSQFITSTITTSVSGLFFSDDGYKAYTIDFANSLNGVRIYQYNLTNPWDITSASFNNSSIFTGFTGEAAPSGIYFGDNGRKMYLVGSTTRTVFQFTLLIPWEITTSRYNHEYFYVGPRETVISDIEFSSDGQNLYIIGSILDTITQYKLDTPWDITTANQFKYFSLIPELPTSEGFFFGNNGNNLYVLGSTSDSLYQYELSTPWDVSSAFYTEKYFSFSYLENTPTDVFLSDDGSILYIVGSFSDSIIKYKLETPWDVSTTIATKFTELKNYLRNEDTVPEGIYLKPDGTKLYFIGSTTDTVYQYSLPVPWDISTLTYDVKSFYIGDLEATPTGISFSNDGFLMYITGTSIDTIIQYRLNVAWDISSAIRVKQFFVNGYEISPSSVGFSTDGEHCYVIGDTTDTIYSFDLSTPWDINTAEYSNKNLYVGYQENLPTGISVKSDGTSVYIVGTTIDTIVEYKLSTPWDITTAPLLKEYYVGDEETAPTSVGLSSDGTKAYVVGTTNDTIYQYTLSTPWDISTGSYANKSLVVSAQEVNPQGFTFSPDGTKMYLIGNNARVYQYTLSTPWDISTGSYINNYLISAQASSPRGIYFKSDGTKFYIICNATDNVYSYSLSTPWNITTTSYDGVRFNVAFKEPNSTDIFFSDDGGKMYIGGTSYNTIHSYTLTVSWDISTATYDNRTFCNSISDTSLHGFYFGNSGQILYALGLTNRKISQYNMSSAWDISSTEISSYYIGLQDATPTEISFASDGNNLYVSGDSTDTVYQYRLDIPWNIGSIFEAVEKDFSIGTQQPLSSGLSISDDGLTAHIIGNNGNDAIHQYNLTVPFDISTAVYNNLSYFVNSEENLTEDIIFADNGFRFYIIGNNKTIYQYSMVTAWDVTSATYDSLSLYIGDEEENPTALYISGDGLKVYVIGKNTDSIHQYSIPEISAWDISTAIYDGSYFSIRGEELIPQSLRFSVNGDKFYVMGNNSRRVHEYSLLVAWDINTAEYSGNNFYVGNRETNPTGLTFSVDGTQMYIVGTTNDRIFQYTLTTPWDISTTLPSSYYIGDRDNETTISSSAISADGTKLYFVGTTNDTIYQYTLDEPWNINTANYDFICSFIGLKEATPTGITFSLDGTEMYIIGSSSDSITQYKLEVPWDISTSYVSFKSIGIKDSSPNDLKFSGDGTKLYILGDVNNAIYQFNLKTPWYVNSIIEPYLRVTAYATPTGLTFSDDGTQVYIVNQTSNDTIYQYSLTTPWDITTAYYRGLNITVSTQENNTQEIFLTDNGSRLYQIGNNRIIYQYNLLDPYNISTLSYTSIFFDVSGQSLSPRSISFNLDGTKVYIVDVGVDNIIYEYDLSTPWDVSTCTYNGVNLVVTEYECDCSSIFFRNNGLSLFIVGKNSNTIYQYSLNTAWDLSTATITNNKILIGNEEPNCESIFIGDSGTKLYIIGTTNDTIFQYSISIAWNISTTTLNSYSINLEDNLFGFEFSSSGDKLYVIGNSNDTVYQYSMSTPWELKSSSYDNKNIYLGIFDITAYDIKISSSGDRLYFLGNTNDRVYQFRLETPWDVSSSYTYPFRVSYQDTIPTGIHFGNEGRELYMVGQQYDKVNQYTLSTPWNISSIEELKQHSFGSIITLPKGFMFDSNGRNLYILNQTSNDLIHHFSLSEPWDVTSIKYTGRTFSSYLQDNNGTDIFLGDNGSKFYMVGGNGRVYEYNLSSKLNLLTSTYSGNNLLVSTQEPTPTGLFFSDDGSNLYIIGTTNDSVYQYSLSTPWNISTATYSLNKYLPEQTNSQGLYIGNNGTKLYVIGSYLDQINQYTLSTPWDISTATYDNKAISVSASNPEGLYFNDSGTKLFVIGSTLDSISEYSLEIAWDISTILNCNELFVGDKDDSITDIALSSNGTKMYILGNDTDTIYQYTLSTPWDIKTSTYDNIKLEYFYERTASGIRFNSDGSKLYIMGSTRDRIYEFKLSTPWNIESANNQEQYIGIIEDAPSGLSFNDDGTKLYYVGTTNSEVNELDLNTPWMLSSIKQNKKFYLSNPSVTIPTGLEFNADGTKVYVVNQASNDLIYEYSLTIPWDITTAYYRGNSLNIFSQENNTSSITFSSDGTKFYIVGTNRRIYQYNSDVPYNLSSFSYSGNNFYLNQSASPTGISFKSDGTKVYIVGTTNASIYQYTLSTPWDILTTTYDNISYSISSQSSALQEITFSEDGTCLFVLGSDTDTIYQYTLSTPWDISTASYANKTLRSYETGPTSFRFSTDGTQAYVLGTINDTIYQYTLSTPWDLSTSNYYDVGSQDSSPTGISFKFDGSSMFILGNTTDSIYEYNLSVPWTINSSTYSSNNFKISLFDTTPTSMRFGNSGYNLYIVGTTNDIVYQFSLNSPYDINTAFYSIKNFNVFNSVSEGSPRDIFFKDDGTKFYMIGDSTDTIYQFTLSTPWDISTSSYDSISLNISNLNTSPRSLSFSDDGTLMYFAGVSANYAPSTNVVRAIYSYKLSTPWDISTANFDNVYYFNSGSVSLLTTINFGKNGTRLYVSDENTKRVVQFNLSKPWDIGTMFYSGNGVYISNELPCGEVFNDDGTIFYTFGRQTDTLYQYSFKTITPWELIDDRHENSLNLIVPTNTVPNNFKFSKDLSKLYVIGANYNDYTSNAQTARRYLHVFKFES